MTKKMSHVFHSSDFLDGDYIKGLIRLMSDYPGRKYILLHEPGYPLNDVVADKLRFYGVVAEEVDGDPTGGKEVRCSLKLGDGLRRLH